MRGIRDGASWGNWRLDAETLTLVLESPSYYEIRLDEITDSAQMLDWIFQIQTKSWATNDVIGNLIRAFDDIFMPQGTLCGQGAGKTINAKKFLSERLGGASLSPR
jgi:hypothetical protein